MPVGRYDSKRPSGWSRSQKNSVNILYELRSAASLEAKRVLGDRHSRRCLPVLRPHCGEGLTFLALGQGHVERVGDVPRPIAERLEPGVVLVPLVSHAGHAGSKSSFCFRNAACLS